MHRLATFVGRVSLLFWAETKKAQDALQQTWLCSFGPPFALPVV
jgi:hypothetical protein